MTDSAILLGGSLCAIGLLLLVIQVTLADILTALKTPAADYAAGELLPLSTWNPEDEAASERMIAGMSEGEWP